MLGVVARLGNRSLATQAPNPWPCSWPMGRAAALPPPALGHMLALCGIIGLAIFAAASKEATEVAFKLAVLR